MLIKSYAERMARQSARHQSVRSFLKDETWTSAYVLAQLLGCSPSQVSKTMQQLSAQHHVIGHQIESFRGTLWGITAHGLAHAWLEDEPMAVRPHFEPSRLSALAIPHHLDVQRARLNAESSGWTGWQPESLLPVGMSKRPDAVAIDLEGQTIAIEIERHIKTLKRYEAIFAAYLQAIKRGEFEAVHYVTPDKALAARLTRVFGLVKAVPLLGERIAITDKHRARFKMSALADWPPKT